MSGVEVIGALASTAQLAYYVIQANSLVIEQFKRLRNAPIKFQQYADTATQLISIARVVQSNQWLQTESMASLLEAILARTEEIHNLLPKVQKHDKAARPGFVSTYWKVFRSLRKEERILAIFAGLEEQKSALALCILEIQTRYTGETSCNVTKLLPMVDSIQEDVSHIRRGTGDLSPTTSSTRSIVPASTATNTTTTTPASTPTSSALTRQGALSLSTQTPVSFDREMTLVESPTTFGAEAHPLSCTYDTPLSNDDATQINGDISIGTSLRMQAHRYFRPSAAGASVQMNGNIASGNLGVLRVLLGQEG